MSHQSASDAALYFVISAGRTGTVFLTRLLDRYFPAVKAEHEPFPARYEFLLGNMANDLGFGRAIALRLFLAARRRRLSALEPGRAYVEVNPMLCPIVDFLPALERPLRVVHMVRAPLDWARSIETFKASRTVRPFFDVIPFARPYPAPRPAGWRTLSPLERNLWRWRVCNGNIVALRASYDAYTLVRYEDLFGADRAIRRRTLTRTLSALRLAADDLPGDGIFDQRANPAPVSAAPRGLEPDAVRAICGDLMADLGYD